MQVSSPDPTAPNVGGVPQSHNFFHPHFSNHANALAMSDTFNIGVRPLASIFPLSAVEGYTQRLSRGFDPAAANDNISVVENRRLAWSDRPLRLIKGDKNFVRSS